MPIQSALPATTLYTIDSLLIVPAQLLNKSRHETNTIQRQKGVQCYSRKQGAQLLNGELLLVVDEVLSGV